MKIAVLGIGNVLVGDDAFGPYVIETFRAQYAVPDDVQVVEVGTPGLDLVPHLSHYDAVIIVDTVRAKDKPGSIRVYDKAQILAHPPGHRSAHDPGLKDTLLMMELTGDAPREVTLIGAIPKHVHTGTGMTDPLYAAVPRAVAHIVIALAAYDVPVSKRPQALTPAIWWERVA